MKNFILPMQHTVKFEPKSYSLVKVDKMQSLFKFKTIHDLA